MLGVRSNDSQHFPESGKLFIVRAIAKQGFSFGAANELCEQTGCEVTSRRHNLGYEWLEIKGPFAVHRENYHAYYYFEGKPFFLEYHGSQDDYQRFGATIESILGNMGSVVGGRTLPWRLTPSLL